MTRHAMGGTMTVVANHGATQPGREFMPARRAEPARWVRWWLVRALPWLVAGGVLAATLASQATPWTAITAYAIYWFVAVIVPGTLVYRALRGSHGNVAEDVGFGAVTGLIMELAAWAFAAATDLSRVLWLWPLAVIGLFALAPRLRRHWRVSDPRPLPLAWSWLIAAVITVAVAWAGLQWRTMPLPPQTHEYYVDTFYLLSLVHELTRPMPWQVPQLAGDPLHYHFLSYGHMAAASMISSVDPVVVLLRLWSGPILAVGVIATAATARALTGRWWTGPLAAAGIFSLPLGLGWPSTVPGAQPISMNSPSLTYVLPVLMLATALACQLVRGQPLRWAWPLLGAAALACTGAKASGLPLLLVGVAAAIGFRAVTQWRERVGGAGAFRWLPWRALAGLAVLVAAVVIGSSLFVGGGANGLFLQPFGTERWMPIYKLTLGRTIAPIDLGFVPGGIAAAGTLGWAFAIAIAGWWLVAQLPRLVGLLALARPRVRRDPAAWLLAGALLTGVVAMWTLQHAAASQIYFFATGMPFGFLLAVWLLSDTVADRVGVTVVGGLVAGGVVLAVVRALHESSMPAPTVSAWTRAVVTPMWIAAVIGGALALGWVVARRWSPWLRGRGVGVAVAMLVGASLLSGWYGLQSLAAQNPDAPTDRNQIMFTADRARAALWLDRHAGRDDVVATNVHCRGTVTKPRCDTRAFWVAGLGGRRTVIESWAYTDGAMSAYGNGGFGMAQQAAPDQPRYQLNERVFRNADPADVAALRARFHVRWLLVDHDAGPVSASLGRVAHARYVDGPITIYELPDA